MGKDFDELNAVELDRLATLIEQSVRDWRGESRDHIKKWLERFWKAKSEETRRAALRRAHEDWLCP